ncbi:MAG: sugar ABC transporter substrate-binding protein [Lachnospiraceae bacterium]
MKRVIALVLIGLMLVGMLSGCGSKGSSDTTETSQDGTPSFSIGFPWATSSTDPVFVSIVTNVRAAVESAGGELVLVESDLSAEDLINNVADLISRDVDGIIFMPASDSMLATVNQMCTEAEVYYGTMFRTINDESIKEEVYASDYFTGGCYEDDEECSYNIVKNMVDQGVENLCVINIAKGDTSSDLRDKGIEKAVEETGITLLNTTYGISSQTDMTKAIESYLAAYPDLDGILLAGTYADAALPTIEKTLSDKKMNGKIIVGRIDFDFTMGEYFENGSFHVAYGGQQQIDPMLSTVILVNSVLGTPIVEDGPFILVTNYLELTSASEANNFLDYFLGDTAVFTPEEIKDTMIKYYNQDINQETFETIVDDFSVQDVVDRHEGMEK